MAVTINLEAHELDRRPVLCPACNEPTLQVDVAITTSGLRTITRASGSCCQACGYEDAWRM